jgi:type II secretory ATPase GspE/PulE/Tfp pilus assembly ATPase PilB-like protein/ActR/RegA family two-component response regulator
MSAVMSAVKSLRDAWLLAALEREGVLSAAAAAELRREAPEWVAAAVTEKRLASADHVLSSAALAAHVPAADLSRVEPTAVQFVPESVARQYAALPLSATNRVIRIATSDPLNLDAEQALGFVAGRQVEFLYALPGPLFQRLDEVYRPDRSIERLVDGLGTQATVEGVEEAQAPQASGAAEAPATRLVEATISDAVRERASDIYFEPSEQGLVIRYRIDGVLKDVMRVPRNSTGSVVRRLKIIARLDIADPLHPHEGRAVARVDGKPWDLRVSTVPVAHYGESVAVHLHDASFPIPFIGELGLWPDERALLETLLANREGAILVTGLADSGITTTLYAAFIRARATASGVVTIEDPVEYRLQGVNQVEVSEKAAVTFAAGLRTALRQNPSLILLGEIADAETAAVAWQAAQSGRLVLSALRVRDSASGVTRLRELGLDAVAIAATLKGVVAQRLVRRLCPRCAEPRDVTSLPEAMRPPAALQRPVAIRKARGCPECGFAGYRGRAAILELLTVDRPVAELIAAGAMGDALVESGLLDGMRTLWQSGLRRVWAGETSYDELVRAVGEPVSRPEAPPIRRTSLPTAPAEIVEVPAAVMVEPPPPAAPEPAPQPAAPAEEQLTLAGPPVVLVADDDPAIRVLVATIMKTQGFEVAEAADGLEALDQAQRLQPAVLLLDIDMPRLDGFGVLEALRRRLAGRSVPVIVVTARDDPATEARCIELGAEDYLAKPIQPSSLVVRIRAVLRRVGVSDSWQRS